MQHASVERQVCNQMFGARFFITVGTLLASFALLHGVSHGEPVPLRQTFDQLPMRMDGWQGQNDPLEEQIVTALGVSDYVNRAYTNAGRQRVDLYVGYYKSQRTGETIHSPKNCLPGSGWEPVRAGHLTIPMAAAPAIVVNEYLIEKGPAQYLVLYWYQAHGRVIASEYSGKAWLVFDAITRNRTDEALVRVLTSTRNGEGQARAQAVQFVQALYPRLNSFIPD
jgi:EpsI family protein